MTQNALMPLVDRKDIGRQQINLSWLDIAGTAAVESALVNFTQGVRGGTALTAATSYTVSTGKTLRIQTIEMYVRQTGTALNYAHFRLRQAASGIANTSPVIFAGLVGPAAATAASGSTFSEVVSIPDGLEVAGGQQITMSFITAANTCVVGFLLTSFEY